MLPVSVKKIIFEETNVTLFLLLKKKKFVPRIELQINKDRALDYYMGVFSHMPKFLRRILENNFL